MKDEDEGIKGNIDIDLLRDPSNLYRLHLAEAPQLTALSPRTSWSPSDHTLRTGWHQAAGPGLGRRVPAPVTCGSGLKPSSASCQSQTWIVPSCFRALASLAKSWLSSSSNRLGRETRAQELLVESVNMHNIRMHTMHHYTCKVHGTFLHMKTCVHVHWVYSWAQTLCV